MTSTTATSTTTTTTKESNSPTTSSSSTHIYNSTSPRTSNTAVSTAIISKKKATTNLLKVEPRKRTKTSRACDECRRKKIRCDANGEEDAQCSSCRRAGEKCSFSRIPMKRGPSKRPRWERSPSEEKKIQGTGEFVLTQAAPAAAAGAVATATATNNRLPSIETLTSPQVQQNKSPREPSPVTSRAIQYRHASVSSESSTSSNTASAPAANGKNAEIKRYSEPDEPGWDDRSIDNYYQVVHPALPILPSSKVRLRSRLLTCSSPALRYTLLCGVNGLVRNNHHDWKQAIVQGIMQISCGGDVKSLNYQSKILYLTTLQLLYLQTSESVWLGMAVSLAYDMNLHEKPHHATNDSEDDYNLSRRLFLNLVTLDRLHSVVNRTPIQIPDEVIHLDNDHDAKCMGSTGVQVIRLCMILGHGSKSTPALLFQELEQAYQTIESMWDTTPILKAMYYLVLVHFDWISINQHSHTTDKRQILANLLNDTNVLTTLLESPLLCVSPLIAFFIPPLVSTMCGLVHHFSAPDDEMLAGIKQQFWQQLDFLDLVIDRRFMQFKHLRHDIHQVRLHHQHHHQHHHPQHQQFHHPQPQPQHHQQQQQQPQQVRTSPSAKLEGLAAVAHAHHQQIVS